MGVQTRLFSEMVQVVPAIIVLTVLLPTIFGENQPQLEFGARVEQAKNLCTNRRNCRFGYTFGRDRDLSTSESKNLQNSLAKKRIRIGNEETSRRRVPRVRIDPRRRKNEEEQVAEDPVTIKIGGVPIVIPDFDLTPAISKAGGETKVVENTLRRPDSDKKRRRNRFSTKRKNSSKNKNRTTLSFKAATPTITQTKSSSRLTTTVSPASRPRSSTTTISATRPHLTTTTSPASRPVTDTLFTTLTSFDSLQQTVENAASAPVSLSTLFTTLSLNRMPITTTPVLRR